jgi:hypothetical protein
MTLWFCVSELSWFLCSGPWIFFDLRLWSLLWSLFYDLFFRDLSSLSISLLCVPLFSACVSKFKVTFRLTVTQSVNLGVEPHLGLMTQIFITVWKLRSCFCGATSLTRGRVCLFICCWLLPVQSFSGLSPLRFATIFYCLRFETCLFVPSYDSQGHGGGIRFRHHTGSLLYVTPQIGCLRPGKKTPCHRVSFPLSASLWFPTVRLLRNS